MYQEAIEYQNTPDAELHAAVMAELDWHTEQDNLRQGTYWTEGKGCAVGCLLKSDDHMEYETKFGIPIMLARLEDRLFEGQTKEDSRAWPKKFMNAALLVGVSRQDRLQKLGVVGWQLLHWLLTEELPKSVVGEGEIYDNVRKAIAQCADVLVPLTKGEKVDKDAAAYAADAARAARAAAYKRMSDKLIELIDAQNKGD